MSLRSRLRGLFRPPDAGVDDLRAELDELASELAAARARHGELEEKVAKLDKRLGMAMGAIQAATTQLMSVRQASDEAVAAAKQANQRATSAQSAAEAAADAVAEL